MTTTSFVCGVVYSAAQIIAAHGEGMVAKELLLSASIKPSDDLCDCAEYDLAILRKSIPGWDRVPSGK